MDYGSGPYTITIPAGNVTMVPFEVKINNDNILEGIETFGLAINLSALPDCIIYANIHQATVTIVDDDGKPTCIRMHIHNSIAHVYIYTHIHMHTYIAIHTYIIFRSILPNYLESYTINHSIIAIYVYS